MKNTSPHSKLKLEAVYSETVTIETSQSNNHVELDPNEKKTIKITIVPEMLGPQKHTVFFKLSSGELVLYLVKVEGIPNSYGIEPIIYDKLL